MAKVTKRENFEAVKAVLEAAGETELVAVMENELELLAKRAGKGRGMTKTQKENVELKANVVEVLTETGALTATEVAMQFEGMTAQKATALLKQLVDAGAVVKTEAKGKDKATFAVAGE